MPCTDITDLHKPISTLRQNALDNGGIFNPKFNLEFNPKFNPEAV